MWRIAVELSRSAERALGMPRPPPMFMNSNSMPSSARTFAIVSKSTPVVSSQYSLDVTQEPVIMWMPKRVAPAAFARRYLVVGSKRVEKRE